MIDFAQQGSTYTCTTGWYKTAKELLLACGEGRGILIELKYIFILRAPQSLVNKMLVGRFTSHN